MKTFGGIPEQYADKNTSKILLQSIPYDGTSTWGKGADKGFDRFIEATENMELYDIETDSEVYKNGIAIIPPITTDSSPEAVFSDVYQSTKELLKTDRFLTFFGGEHSISIGIIKAFYEKYPDITILQIDAHADLRPQYLGTPYNHACALYDASKHTDIVQVGIRSMDIEEKQYLQPNRCFFAHEIQTDKQWMEKALSQMNEKVYITFDLDAFDPSILPATGTPEPGGLLWYETLEFLKKVFEQKQVLGFDLVELAPIEGLPASEFLVSKLYYKMLSYKFENKAH